MNAALMAPLALDLDAFDALLATRPEHERWELIDGIAVMMNPPYQRHQLIAGNLLLALAAAAEDQGAPWYPYFGVGVRVPSERYRSTIPDLLVRRGPVQDSPWCSDPIVVVEIASRSTVSIDRGWKLAFYQSIPTIEHILSVRQDRVLVERLDRADGWRRHRFTDPEATITLSALGASLALARIYRRTGLLEH